MCVQEMDAGIRDSKPKRAIPKFSTVKAVVVPTFIFVGKQKAGRQKCHLLQFKLLLVKVLFTGKISAQLWQLIQKLNTELKRGVREYSSYFCS